ncbi:MAG: hypothetical protein ACREQ9_05045 [Candidatus Binatia bacterium]
MAFEVLLIHDHGATLVPDPAARRLLLGGIMDILPILDRAIDVERGAGEIYERIAARFPEDRRFADFWLGMADDERQHAHKLSVWRTLLELLPGSRRPMADGFERGLLELENLVREAGKKAAAVATPDEAFAIALELEESELDVIYTTLIQSSPLKRFPDIEDTRRRELGRHHAALAREVRRRSRDQKNLLQAELITAAG